MDIKCNNVKCPKCLECATFSDDSTNFILVEKEFDSGSECDEQGFFCEAYEYKDII